MWFQYVYHHSGFSQSIVLKVTQSSFPFVFISSPLRFKSSWRRKKINYSSDWCWLKILFHRKYGIAIQITVGEMSQKSDSKVKESFSRKVRSPVYMELINSTEISLTWHAKNYFKHQSINFLINSGVNIWKDVLILSHHRAQKTKDSPWSELKHQKSLIKT